MFVSCMSVKESLARGTYGIEYHPCLISGTASLLMSVTISRHATVSPTATSACATMHQLERDLWAYTFLWFPRKGDV